MWQSASWIFSVSIKGVSDRFWFYSFSSPRAYDPSGLQQESRALGATQEQPFWNNRGDNRILPIRNPIRFNSGWQNLNTQLHFYSFPKKSVPWWSTCVSVTGSVTCERKALIIERVARPSSGFAYHAPMLPTVHSCWVSLCASSIIHVLTGPSRKRWRLDYHVISLPEFSLNVHPKLQAMVSFSKPPAHCEGKTFGVLSGWNKYKNCSHALQY